MKRMWSYILLVIVFVGCSKPNAEDMYKKGEDAQKADQFDAAISAYQELIKAYPDSTRTPEAVYAIGTIYQNHKQSFHMAIQTYRQLIEKYPHHATSPSASFLIGFMYNNDLKNIDSARIAYEDFLNRYPNDQLAVSARFELDHLGKDPAEILKAQTQVAQEETKPAKKGKNK